MVLNVLQKDHEDKVVSSPTQMKSNQVGLSDQTSVT
jgi:hypothetical protein